MVKAAAWTSETKRSVKGHLASTSTPTRAAPGRSSRKSPSCFVPCCPAMKLTPVTLPPGRLRLATRPSLTGSPPVVKTIGIVVVAALAAIADWVGVMRSDHRHLTAYQIGCEVWQSIVLVQRPAILDRHVLALDIAGLVNALAKCGHKPCSVRG